MNCEGLHLDISIWALMTCGSGAGVFALTLSTRPGHLCSVSGTPAKWLWVRILFSDPLTTPPELINIFEIFLPQLLRYPNPADPLNGEAAALLMRDAKAYAKKVESYVGRFATPEDADQAGEGEDDDEDEDEAEDQPMGGTSGRPKTVEKATATNTNGHSNGHSTGNGEANGNGKADGADVEAEEEDADKMSDMGALSDGDEFMGEMDD